jgi:putative ABC transport system permease protein
MIHFALANLLSRPGRSALSIFGLTIAIAGMVGLFSISGGIDSLIESSLGDLEGLIILQNGAPIPLFSTLPAGWGDEVAEVEGVSVVTPEYWSRANLIDGKSILSPPRLLLGTEFPTWLQRRQRIFEDAVTDGRFFTVDDVGTNRTVISRQIADEFDKSVGDPIVVNGHELEIIGIYEVGSILLDVTIIVDIDLLRRMTRAAPDTVSAFYLETDPGVAQEQVKARIEALFANRRLPVWQPTLPFPTDREAGPSPLAGLLQWGLGLLTAPGVGEAGSRGDRDDSVPAQQSPEPAEQDDAVSTPPAEQPTPGQTDGDLSSVEQPSADQRESPIQVQSVSEWSKQFEDLSADLDIILTLLTGLGVAIAVSSILNTMLMSVTERIVEFGILRANGWSQQNVVQLIVCEAAMVGAAGGLLGVLAGWGATHVINAVWADRIHLYASGLLLGFSLVFAVAVGMLGGFYPALRAARLSPMDAIRRS